MKIFFDTEFTGLHKDTTLISIGLVDENGRSFYAEFLDYDENQCDDWIKENVLSHLTLGKYEHVGFLRNDSYACGKKEFIKNKLEEWLLPYDKVELVSDVCHYDMVLFIDIWGGAFDIPRCINPACHDINQDIAIAYIMSETQAFDKSREEIIEYYGIKIDGNKHNSLYDAKVIKAIYESLESEIGIVS